MPVYLTSKFFFEKNYLKLTQPPMHFHNNNAANTPV